MDIINQVKNELTKIYDSFVASERQIKSFYGMEQQLTKDYDGRQLFELLQNADDEAIDGNGHVKICLRDGILTVSNTGNPFDFDGVCSLLRPSDSSKAQKENKIGYKGLGFRSILSWADEIRVIDNSFAMGFSHEYARDFLFGNGKNQDLLSKLRAIEKSSPFPVPILSCPKFLEGLKPEENYTTTIYLKCKNKTVANSKESLIDNIKRQLCSFKFEELIFLPRLKKIEILCDGFHKIFEQLPQDDKRKCVICERDMLNENNSRKIEWTLFSKNETIQDENGKDRECNFVIAYDEKSHYSGKVLYSYFPTQIPISFPAIIHGNFELTSNRNSILSNNHVNAQMIDILVDFLIETAVCIASGNKVSYSPLKLVISNESNTVLDTEYNFTKKLRAAAKEKKLLPTVSNTYISFKDYPKFSRLPFANILCKHPQKFKELLLHCDDSDILSFLEENIHPYYQFYYHTELTQRIDDNLDYTIQERCELIYLIDTQYSSLGEYTVPHLLVDTEGNSIKNDNKVFTYPTNEGVIKLPSFATISFINKEMNDILSEKFNKSNRDLQKCLDKYKLTEYNFASIANSICRQIKNDETGKATETLKWLYAYYSEASGKEDIVDLQKSKVTQVKIPCRNGTLTLAEKCYFGEEYGNSLGEKIVSSFSADDDDIFIKSTNDLDLPSDDYPYVSEFLEWLGVSKFPRIISINCENHYYCSDNYYIIAPYLDYCFNDENFLMQSQSFGFSEKSKLLNHLNMKVFSVEHLDDILQNEDLDFNDKLAWLMSDTELSAMLYSDCESEGSYIKSSYNRTNFYISAHNMPSFLLYKLKTLKWIQGKDNLLYKSDNVCMENYELEPFVCCPDINYGKLARIKSKRDIEWFLINYLGVHRDFYELPHNTVYEILFNLKDTDPDGKKAKAIYRKVKEIEGIAAPQEFKDNGYVLTKHNEEYEYVPVSKARYAGNKIFSKEILKQFNMFEISTHSGNNLIQKVFGVKPLTTEDAELMEEPDFHILEEDFKKEYELLRPYFFACIKKANSSSTNLSSIRNSSIHLCSDINISFKLSDSERKEISLNDNEVLYLKKKNIAYVKVSDKNFTLEDLKNDNDFSSAIAEIVSSIFDSESELSFFRFLFQGSQRQRDYIIYNDKDLTREEFNEIKKNFNVVEDAENDFWRIIGEIKNCPFTDTQEIIKHLNLNCNEFSDIDYRDFSSTSALSELIELFKKLKIDAENFNALSPYHIDFSKLHMEKFQLLRSQYYKQFLYYKYCSLKGNSNCISEFEAAKDSYFMPVKSCKNSAYVDICDFYREIYDVDTSELEQYISADLEDELSQKRNALSDEKKAFLESCAYKNTDMYILFDLVDELIEEQNRKDAKEFSKDSSKPLDLCDIASIHLSKPTLKIKSAKIRADKSSPTHSSAPRKSKASYSPNYQETEDSKKTNGMIGEIAVYKALLEEGYDVNWVSSNAQLAKIRQIGNDSLGYDMQYTTEENGVTVQHYVEVKASRKENISFCISTNELKFALKNIDNYHLFFVRINDDKQASEILDLSNIFKLKDSETVFDNSNFTIDAREYNVTALID